MPALKARFQDANRNTGAQALLLLASLARAMGRPIVREARPILGPAVKCLCDSKPNVSWVFGHALGLGWVGVSWPQGQLARQPIIFVKKRQCRTDLCL